MTPTASFFSLKSQGHIPINKQYFFSHSNSAGVQEKPLRLFVVAFPFGFLLTGLLFLCISRCVGPCWEETSLCSERICWIFPVGISYAFVTELSTDIPNRKRKTGPRPAWGQSAHVHTQGPPSKASEYLGPVLEGEMPSVVPDGSQIYTCSRTHLWTLCSVLTRRSFCLCNTRKWVILTPCGSTLAHLTNSRWVCLLLTSILGEYSLHFHSKWKSLSL